MKQQLIIIISVGLAAIFILFGGLVYLGIDINKETKEIANLRSELEINSKASESMVLLQSDINAIAPYLEKINSALPSKDGLIKFPSDMKILASSSLVDFSSEFSGEGIDNSGLKWVGLRMSLDGNFGNITDFLKNLETGQYSIKLDTLDFIGSSGKFKTLINGKVFYF